VSWHLAGLIPFGIDIVIYLLPFIFILNFIYKKRDLFLKLNVLVYGCTALLAGVLIYAFEPIKTTTEYLYRIDFAQLSVPENLFGYFTMSLLSGSLLMVFLKIKNDWLSWVGKYTFPIFLMHIFILSRFTGLLKRLLGGVPEHFHLDGWVFLYSFFVFISVVFIPIFISRCLMHFSEKWKYIGMVK
jgi:peptidoglycan/LPS O-acetylase OafA/YrhL